MAHPKDVISARLVRPDQHIAWRCNQVDAPGAARILANALGFTQPTRTSREATGATRIPAG